MNLQIKSKENAVKLITLLERAGYKGYFVGGCVRDMIMGRQFHDIDIATSAKPYETKRVFEDAGYNVYETGIKHGTVSVLCEGEIYEITTYRIDGSYSDSRHPDYVEFTDDITLDLERRDFTVNAMAMDSRGGLVDPFFGRRDIEKRIIRCVGDAGERFSEDALRVLRAVRFSSVLGFIIEESTLGGMKDCCRLISNVAGERIFAELSKLFGGKDCWRAVFSCPWVMDGVLPEFPVFTSGLLGYDQDQLAKELSRLGEGFEMRLAALICLCGRTEELCARMTDGLITRIKPDKNTAATLRYMVNGAFAPISAKKSVINREMAKWGRERLGCLLKLKGMMSRLSLLPFDNDLDASWENYFAVANNGCITLADLAVNGDHLLKLGVARSKKTGEILNLLLDAVVEGEVENREDKLLALVKERFIG